jgi:hypothetical protein
LNRRANGGRRLVARIPLGYNCGVRFPLSVAALVSGSFVVFGGCRGSVEPCPAACVEAAFAIFSLSCSPNDLISVEATGPCSMPDAGLSWYTGTATEWYVAVGSRSPGTCHVLLTFESGFTFSADVTFASQNHDRTCGCPPFIGPTSGPFIVNNPGDTCVDASTDARSDE